MLIYKRNLQGWEVEPDAGDQATTSQKSSVIPNNHDHIWVRSNRQKQNTMVNGYGKWMDYRADWKWGV